MHANQNLQQCFSLFIDVQDGNNYKEAMKILKLVVTRCSTLVVPPYWDSHASSILDAEMHGKKVTRLKSLLLYKYLSDRVLLGTGRENREMEFAQKLDLVQISLMAHTQIIVLSSGYYTCKVSTN